MNEITVKLMKSFPIEMIRHRPGENGQPLSYLEGSTVLRRLIEATDNNFNFKVVDVSEKNDVVIAICELEIEGLGKRQHIGCVRTSGSEDEYKAAITDALKKTAWLFGINLGCDQSESEQVHYAQNARTQPRAEYVNGQQVAATVRPQPARSAYRGDNQ